MIRKYTITGSVLLGICLLLSQPVAGRIIYVDDDANGLDNGSSWANAYKYLQDALLEANSNLDINEIRVAQGIYKPDSSSAAPNGTGDQTASFQLINGAALRGGYAGIGTPDPNARNINDYESILSGDLNGDDEQIFPFGKYGNSHHVVDSSGTNELTVIDGFTIAGGNGGQENSGGGMYNVSGSPILIDCTFYHNVCRNFKAMFEDEGYGAGMFNYNGSPRLINIIFRENMGVVGGGMYNLYSNPEMVNCEFRSNYAVGSGLYNEYSSSSLTNCIFSGNYGGVICDYGPGSTLTNCTFIGNFEGISCGYGSFTLSNCVLWGNTGDWDTGYEINIQAGIVYINHSNLQGGRESVYLTDRDSFVEWGPGNIDVDPLLTPDGHLRAGSSCINFGDLNFAPDPNEPNDIDGDARIVNMRVDMGADEFLDSDGDGLPNFWEQKYFGDVNAANPDVDTDGDGLTNSQEYEYYGSNPISPPYFVDTANGNDSYDGKASIHQGGNIGPKKTIQAGIDAATSGDTVLVASGLYSGPGNFELDYAGELVIVRSVSGSDFTTIDCGNAGRAIDSESVTGVFAVLEGFTITGGYTPDYSPYYGPEGCQGGGISIVESRSMFKDCVLRDNKGYYGGFSFKFSAPIINGLLIQDNDTWWPNGFNAGLIRDSNINLQGDLTIEAGRLGIISSRFYGPGRINIDEDALLKVTGDPGADPTVIRTDVNGPGNIKIDAGDQLIIEGDAVVNLSGSSQCNPDPNIGGVIDVNGLLWIRGNATLEGTNVNVKLLDIDDPNIIQYNNITLQEASTGFGGEFFVSDGARIICNNIVSEGDRYLDLDPNPNTPQDQRPEISHNRISVIINEGILGSQGTLLELRAKDYDWGRPDSNNPEGLSGAYQVSSESEGFTDDPSENWVLEKLILEKGAKLNLTNRQGFEFQDFNDPNVETVYVKELIMGPNSILNTGLQTLYYQTLIITDSDGVEIDRDPNDLSMPFINGSRLEDIPLLGFSLGIIAMNDPKPSPHNEFDIRVRRRLMDPRDPQPPDEPNKVGSIERIDSDPELAIPPRSGGVMDMRTQAPGKHSASSVAAKGAFARAGDEDITVEFEYLFTDDPNGEAEIIVYLSDDPEVSRNLVELAHIYPRGAGLPGSIGSGRFAVFSGMFSRGDLNFARGTYVELELRGKGARCWIDNWDPQIMCALTCCDYDGFGYVTTDDLYLLLAEIGLSDPNYHKGCLDLVVDGCITADDLLAWDTIHGRNACPGSDSYDTVLVPAEASMAALSFEVSDESTAGPLHLFGLPYDWKFDPDNGPSSRRYLYTAYPDSAQATVDGNRAEPSGRLLMNGNGSLYQIAGNGGLMDRDGRVVLIPKKAVTYPEDNRSSVTVGFHEGEGLLLLDAVFHPQDLNIVYIVPVLVDPNDGGCPYMAAAKLELKGDGDWELLKLYGKRPPGTMADCSNFRSFVYNPDMYHPCEIEIDSSGENVFVLSRCWLNSNNWVLIYDEGIGNDSQVHVWLSDPEDGYPDVDGPTAMLVSSFGQKVYLASSVIDPDDPNDLTTEVYGLSMSKYGKRVSGLIWDLEDITEINCPQPEICSTTWNVCDPHLGYVSLITSMTENPVDGTLYAAGLTTPKLSTYGYLPSEIDRIFTTPILAAIPVGSHTVNAKVIAGADLALPLSMVWSGAKCALADLTGDGKVNMNDVAVIAGRWLNLTCISPEWCDKADLNRSKSVNFVDLSTVAQYWLETGCDR